MISRLAALPLDVVPGTVERAQASLDDWRSPDFAPNLEKMQFPTVWNVVRYWRHCLETAGRKVPEKWAAPQASFRPAKELLAKYEYPDILRAIRWATSPQGIKHFFTLWWLLRDDIPAEVNRRIENGPLKGMPPKDR